jgi:hypothetical protein
MDQLFDIAGWVWTIMVISLVVFITVIPDDWWRKYW